MASPELSNVRNPNELFRNWGTAPLALIFSRNDGLCRYTAEHTRALREGSAIACRRG